MPAEEAPDRSSHSRAPGCSPGPTQTVTALGCQRYWSATRRGLASVERAQLGSPGWPRSGPKGSCRFSQGGGEPLGIKDGFVFEHKVSSAGQLDGDDRVGLEFVAVHPGLQLLGQGLETVVVAFGDDGRFPEGPAQVGVAQLGAAQAFALSEALLKRNGRGRQDRL